MKNVVVFPGATGPTSAPVRLEDILATILDRYACDITEEDAAIQRRRAQWYVGAMFDRYGGSAVDDYDHGKFIMAVYVAFLADMQS